MNFAVKESLEEFHLPLKSLQLSIIDLTEDPDARIFNCLNALLLHFKHFIADLNFKFLERVFVKLLTLDVQIGTLCFYEFQDLLVYIRADVYVVELVSLVLVADTLTADSLFVIEAEKLELLSVS